jgi:hypothetical protein
MVALRSTKQDRTLLIVLWLFTAVVLTLGGLAVSPILLVWGTVGLLAAVFLTRIHVRDTRASATGDVPPGQQPGPGAAPLGTGATDETEKEPADSEESR